MDRTETTDEQPTRPPISPEVEALHAEAAAAYKLHNSPATRAAANAGMERARAAAAESVSFLRIGRRRSA